jgi:effector-binding domain-containing protein
MDYAIQIREAGPQPVLSIRAITPIFELIPFFDEACTEMRAYLEQVGVQSVGPAMSLWHSAPGEIKDGFDIETCLPVEGPLPSSGRMHYRELPASLQAFTVHKGGYEDMRNAFDAVWDWIRQHGYEMAGPPRDVVLVGPGDTGDPAAYRTEIVYPVSARE